MGLFDRLECVGPEFVCSEGHDLSGEEFQTKGLGCTMGGGLITHGKLRFCDGGCGDEDREVPLEIYCTCRKCPAFVQFGTGNEISCGVEFEVMLDGDRVVSVKRVSQDTADWLASTPLERHMHRCEGPMPYAEVIELHIHYKRMRPEHAAEFAQWSKARSVTLQAGKPWSLDLQIGEYPQP